MRNPRSSDPIVTSFDRLARRRADRPLVVSRARTVTVAGVDALARAASTALTRAGLRERCAVGVVAPNGSGFLAALLACRRAGHPAALFDATATAREIGATARRLGLGGLLRTVAAPEAERQFRVTRLRAAGGGDASWRDRVLRKAAVIKMTSGSSGRPRGVACTAAALLADDAAIRAAMGIGIADRLIAAVPFAHSYGLSSLVIPALTDGLPLLLPDAGTPLAPWIAARELGGTVLPTVPAFVAGLAALQDAPPWPGTLRLMITAGAPLRAETARRFRLRFGRAAHVFYGASEVGGIAFDASGEAGERGTVGTPLPGVRVTIESTGAGHDAAGAGAAGAGRLVVRSPAAALSYLPEADAALEGGCFRTADLARSEGREIVLLGRLDALINVRGRKIDPLEVERHIARLEHVEEVVVHAVRGPGDAEPRVRAVVACPSGRLSGAMVRHWCRGRLGDHKVPREILLVPSLPLTPRGKVDRVAVMRLPSRTSSDG